MTPLINDVWKLTGDACKVYQNENPNFVFDVTKKDDFKDKFMYHYSKIKDKYMYPSVKYLDRHKVAAIIIISILETNSISCKSIDKDNLFIGAELVAIKVALAYMVEKLNEKLAERGCDYRMKKFNFPEAQSCETPYIEIICRNLYFAKEDFVYNPLDLADRLFLIEYIALIKDDIDPNILKDYV